MYDRDRDRPTSGAGARLLPWETPEGKPCYLSTDDNADLLWRVADEAEEKQLRLADDCLDHAHRVLANPTAGPLTLRVALQRTSTCLSDTLRIADSRGARLPLPDEPYDP
ncbi:hypothetical protein [Streptomyces sp. 6N223]|uniref:hypothetical protein n=1 Tax=Streptomyces sp. 6N223 TaxID=3457412 RepID=UPI003FCFDA6A